MRKYAAQIKLAKWAFGFGALMICLALVFGK